MRKLIEEVAYRNKESVFKDRLHAAELLASKLREHVDVDTQLLAIPSGGVPVGHVIAKKLNIVFDIIIVRKIQIPWNTEAGFGAVTWDGDVILNEPLLRALALPVDVVNQCILETREKLQARLQKFRGERPFPELRDRDVVVVDDGLASGFTMLAAVRSIGSRAPRSIVVAVPTASARAVELLEDVVDKLICLNVRGGPIFAVADAYHKWYDLPDEEVMAYLAKSWNCPETESRR